MLAFLLRKDTEQLLLLEGDVVAGDHVVVRCVLQVSSFVADVDALKPKVSLCEIELDLSPVRDGLLVSSNESEALLLGLSQM